jgi:hypothetical protein
MTQLLRQAITEIEKLPASEQDSVAARILAELVDDQVWAAKFAATSEQQWDRLAESVRREIADGDTIPLEDVLPRGQQQP